LKILLQRVASARVEVETVCVGAIGHGLLLLVCGEPDDDEAVIARLARKIAKLRIFADEAGRMNLSVRDVGGAVLAVSQFTLAADLRRGNRPGFTGAAPAVQGRVLYDGFCAALEAEGLEVARGQFGADMAVHLVNDGPVTIWIYLRNI